MFLRRAYLGGRRNALRLTVPPARLRHSTSSLVVEQENVSSEPASPVHGTPEDVLVYHEQINFKNAIKSFHQTIAHSKVSARASYDALRAYLDEARESIPPLSPTSQQLLWRAFSLLARSRSEDDYDILVDGVWRFARLQKMSVDKYAQEVFSRIIAHREPKTAYQWLIASAKIPAVSYASELPAWRELLELAAELRNQHVVDSAFRHLREELGLHITKETALMVFEASFRTRPASRTYHYQTPPFTFIKHVINILPSHRIPFDNATLRTIVDGYIRDGHEEYAQEAEFVYVSALGNSKDVSREHFNRIIAEISSRKDRELVARACKRFIHIGLTPSEDTLLAVLGDSFHIHDLSFWQRQLRVAATPKVIGSLMNQRAARQASVIELYQYAQTKGIKLTGEMLYHVVKPLLTSRGVEKPTDQAIDQALDLYRDFIERLRREEQSGQGHAKQTPEVNFFSSSPDIPSTPPEKANDMSPNAATYQLLIRALTASKNIEKYLPVAISLIGDMQGFGMRLDPQTTASVLILLMNASATPEEAYEMYRIVCSSQQIKGASLNEEGYVAVLDAFCKLPTWPGGIPSTQLYFSIIDDMRKRGVRLGPKMYTVILAQMGKLATAALKNDDIAAQEIIAKAIMRTHNKITLNPSFTPDTPLYNQLMDAYQRAGCFVEACRVWQMLYASGRFSAASVSIILDACAYARAYDMAVRIYSMLKDVRFPLTIKNWNTYLECLCRVGKLDEAVKVACLEMAHRDDGVEPDAESVRILLKFAMRTNQEMEVRSRLKRYLPRLCSTMPEFAPS
ncbi:hypothetical protein PYCCODRAFT_1458655 [Trametes coccinea BRFM310]|uniref:FHA domain-containing protein n=1 Tax=Trametes coccinea (strain BRFM310) TaxID=1353009 RepID=A0A1Y2IQ61_TRAC3|nr:hypothetical protein PYCCODRAFT_1458655 [Trametes coccinea BRFM310]